MNMSKKVAIEGFLVGVSIWIGIMEHHFSLMEIQILQGMYLIPIFIIRDLFGFKSGVCCIILSSFIRCIFFSKAGILGFLIRIVPIIYLYFRKDKECNIKTIIFFDLIGIFLTLLCKIPLHYLFFIKYLQIDASQMKNMFVNYLLITNLLRLSISVIISRANILKNIFKGH